MRDRVIYRTCEVAPGRILAQINRETVRVIRFGPSVHNQHPSLGISGTHRDEYDVRDAQAVCDMLNRRPPPGVLLAAGFYTRDSFAP